MQLKNELTGFLNQQHDEMAGLPRFVGYNDELVEIIHEMTNYELELRTYDETFGLLVDKINREDYLLYFDADIDGGRGAWVFRKVIF